MKTFAFDPYAVGLGLKPPPVLIRCDKSLGGIWNAAKAGGVVTFTLEGGQTMKMIPHQVAWELRKDDDGRQEAVRTAITLQGYFVTEESEAGREMGEDLIEIFWWTAKEDLEHLHRHDGEGSNYISPPLPSTPTQESLDGGGF